MNEAAAMTVNPSVLDYTGRGLKNIECVPVVQPSTVIYDKNAISKLENLDKYKNLQQLSVAENRIVRMIGVSKLRSLCVLNLPNNSIVSIEGLKELKDLTWLNLSGNSVKVIEHLSTNVKLRHLDVSDNCVSTITNISNLANLKTLLLHGNVLTNLKTAPKYLPKCITVLSLAENELTDLNEISCLSSLTSLEQLSIMNNPCVLMTASSPGFDYRPFVINWCLNLKVLDGYIISEKESLKSEWLYSQGKGRYFHLGDHFEMAEYLAEVCPLTGTAKLETIEETRLNQILSKQRYHQEQLGLQKEGLSKPRTLSPDLRKGTPPSGDHGDDSSVRSATPSSVASDISTSDTSTFSKEPIKAWGSREGSLSTSSLPQRQQQIGLSNGDNNLLLQDIISEGESEDDATISDLLESDSVYLPLDFGRSPDQSQSSMLLSQPTEDSTMQTGIPIPSASPQREELQRPATTGGINIGSKYDAYEKRPLKPLNQEISRSRVPPPTFQYAPPMQSDAEPKVGTKKRANSPLLQAQDYDVQTGESEKEEVSTDDTVTKANLSNIKDIAQAKKLQKLAQKPCSSRKLPRPILSTTTQKGSEDARCRTAPPSMASHRAGEIALNNSRGDHSVKASGQIHDGRKPTGPRIDNYMTGSVRDSGFLSRPVSDATDCLAMEDENVAATKVQALWRGYWARHYNPAVTSVRNEIRVRRTEDHLIFLKAELERQRSLYEEEKQLRNLQLEAIRHLWKEVQTLQSWKTEVLSSNALSQHIDSNRKSQKHMNRELQNTMEKIDIIKGQNEDCRSSGESSTVTVTSEAEREKRLELERTCVHLQSQVLQLRQLLQNVSKVVYSRDYFAKAFEDPSTDKKEGTIRVTGNFEDIPDDSAVGESLHLSHWGNVPHSLSPYPSDEEHLYFWQVPHPGCPTPPKGLRLAHKGTSSLILKWQPSRIIDESQQEVDRPVLGYRVYVNDVAKGMVSGDKTYAMVEGLDPQITYKLYVKGVSNIGESLQSDVVMAALSKCLEKTRTRRSSSSDNNPTDDSDKDHDSTESLREDAVKRKRELPLRNSQRSKRKSPRREKDKKDSEKSKKGTEDKDESVTPGHSYDPFSRKDSSSADEITIIRHARLHTPKSGRSRDRQIRSPENVLLSSGAESTSSHADLTGSGDGGGRLSTLPPMPNRSPRDEDTGHVGSLSVAAPDVVENSPCSETSSGASPKETESNSDATRSDSSRDDKVKTHKRQRSKDIPNIVTELVQEENEPVLEVGQVNKGTRERSQSFSSVANVIQMIEDREKKDSSSDGSSKDKGQSHRKKRTSPLPDWRKEDALSTGSGKVSSSKADAKDRNESLSTVLSKPKPVIDGRKRHSSGQGSRSNSPMAQDGGEKEVVNKPPIMERRRTPVVDMLEQRFASKMNSASSGSIGVQAEKLSNLDNSSATGKPTEGQRSRHGSGEMRDVSPEDVRRSKSENSSPTDKYHPPGALGSESDSSVPPSSKNKTHNNFVSKLLQKLQTFSKSQEQTIRDSKKTLKSRAKSSSDTALSGGRDDQRGPTRVRTISAGDGSGEEDNGAVITVHSDSSSGSALSDGKRKSSKGHKRSSSHGAGPIVAKDLHSMEGAHSPIIMEGAKKKPSAAPVTGVRRHASFHGLLPSKSHDIRQGHGSEENLSSKKTTAKPAPTESSGQPTFRSRSRSPSPNTSAVSGVHQPVLSAAQLQRLKSPPGVGQ